MASPRNPFRKIGEAVVAAVLPTPTLPEAQAQLEEAQREAVEAQAAYAAAEQQLDTAHLGNEPSAVLAAEAGLATAATVRDRARRRLAAAQTRHAAARAAHDAKQDAEAKATVGQYTEIRAKSAERIANAVAEIRAATDEALKADVQLATLAARGLVERHTDLMRGRGYWHRLIEIELARAGLLPKVALAGTKTISEQVSYHNQSFAA